MGDPTRGARGSSWAPLNCVKCDQQAPRDERPAQVSAHPGLFPANTLTLARLLGRLLEAKRGTVSCAESCTGGLIAAVITEISGSSAWFEQSWITYSNAAKHQQLGSVALHSGKAPSAKPPPKPWRRAPSAPATPCVPWPPAVSQAQAAALRTNPSVPYG